jgi:hypothetical protein
MNIQPWSDVQWRDDAAWKQFVFMHMVAHNNMAEYFADQNLKIDNFPFDDVPWSGKPDEMQQLQDFLFLHQRVHVELANRLSLTAPPDLELYKLNDEDQFNDWTSDHAAEHDRLLLAIGF